MKIASKQGNVRVFSSNPSFTYFFKDADVPVEIQESHAEKILRNPDFYEFEGELPKETKKVHPDGWKQELEAIKGIGKKTSDDILKIFPNKESLGQWLEEGKELPFDNDIAEKLKKAYSQ